jgi:hypothetical protein
MSEHVHTPREHRHHHELYEYAAPPRPPKITCLRREALVAASRRFSPWPAAYANHSRRSSRRAATSPAEGPADNLLTTGSFRLLRMPLVTRKAGLFTRPHLRLLLWSPPPESNWRPHPYHGTTGEPLCGPPLPQLTPDHKDRSYRSSSGEVMRSPSRHVVRHYGEPSCTSGRRTQSLSLSRSIPSLWRRRQSSEQYGSLDHKVIAALAASRIAPPSTSTREVGIPRPGHAQMKASGPGGGRGRAR